MDEDYFGLSGLSYYIDYPHFEGTEEEVKAQRIQYRDEYTQKIPAGSIFTFVMEPENPFDESPAIAAYLDYRLVCYVKKNEKDVILPYMKDSNRVKIKYMGDMEDGILYLTPRNRLSSERYNLEMAAKKNLEKKASETELANTEEDKSRFKSSAIGFRLPPFFMHEEIGMLMMAEDVARYLDYIMNNDWEDATTIAVAKQTVSLLERYAENAYCSLSVETSYAFHFIYNKLRVLHSRSETLRELFDNAFSLMKSMSRKIDNGVLQMEIYDRQLKKASEDFYKEEIYRLYKDRVFHNGLAPTNVEIDEQTKKIKDWLGSNLPAGIFALLKDDKKAFARRLSNAELSMIDLHMVYSHITLLGYNKMLHDNWQDDPTTIPAKVQYRSDEIEIDIHKVINKALDESLR